MRQKPIQRVGARVERHEEQSTTCEPNYKIKKIRRAEMRLVGSWPDAGESDPAPVVHAASPTQEGEA
jgi:hypothetical protein